MAAASNAAVAGPENKGGINGDNKLVEDDDELDEHDVALETRGDTKKLGELVAVGETRLCKAAAEILLLLGGDGTKLT